MATTEFRPEGREKAPTVPSGTKNMPQRLVMPRAIPMPTWQKGLILAVGVVVVGMVILMVTQSSFRSGPMGIMSIFFPLMLVVTTVGMIAGGRMRGGNDKQLTGGQLDEGRKDYFMALDVLGDDAQDTAQAQFEQAQHFHPNPGHLRGLVNSKRMWERKPNVTMPPQTGGDGRPVERTAEQLASMAFGWVRMGLGRAKLAMQYASEDQGDPAEYDPACFEGERQFDLHQQTVPDIPIAVSLPAAAGLGLVGVDGMEAALGLARAMVLQATVFHSPRDFKVMVLTSTPERWDWMKWLPHNQLSEMRRADTGGSARMVWTSLTDMTTAIGHELEQVRGKHVDGPTYPHWLIICDQERVSADWDAITRSKLGGVSGVTFLRLASERGDGLEFTDRATYFVGESEVTDVRGEPVVKPDYVDVRTARTVARKMARFAASESEDIGGSVSGDGAGGSPDLCEMLGIEDALNPNLDRLWARVRSGPPFESTPWSKHYLRFPFGVDEYGQEVALDFKETQFGGMGVHMLGIGYTGSGKSEFLKTLIKSMCATHSPEQINIAFFDFKGTATASGIRDFAHVVAAVSNLGGDVLLDRMREGILGEAERRKRLLDRAGASSVAEYEYWRIHRGEDLEPIPHLFVIVDEHTQWFADRNEEAKEISDFLTRQGRSLEISLIMMSQYLGHQLGSGQGAMKNTPIRIALRVLDENDSREIIGVPDAKHLPLGAAGAGYLRVVGESRLVRFQSAYVSKDYKPPAQIKTAAEVREEGGYVPPALFTAVAMEALPEPKIRAVEQVKTEPEAPREILGEDGRPLKQIQAMQRAIAEKQAQSEYQPHRIWCPELEALPADELVRRLRGKPWWQDYGSADRLPLLFAVALEDRPFEHTQRVYAPDVTDTNCQVPGRGQSGRTTAVTTMILSAALTYTPKRVQFVVVAMSGPDINAVQKLPHVISFTRGDDEQRVRRSVAEMKTLIAEREAAFERLDINAAEFRERKFGRRDGSKADGELPEDAFGDVFLVLEGFGEFRKRYEAATARPGEGLLADIEEIASRGPAHGVHLIISTDGYIAAKFTPAMMTAFGANVEMKLPDTEEFTHNPNPQVAKTVPFGVQEVLSDEPDAEQQLGGQQPNAIRITGRGRSKFGYHFQAGRPWLSVAAAPADTTDSAAAELDVQTEIVPANDERAMAWINQIAGPSVAEVRILPEELSRETMWKRFDELHPHPIKGLVPFGLSEIGLSAAVADFNRDPHFVLGGAARCGKSEGLATFAQGIMDVYTPEEAKLLVISTDHKLVQFVPDEYLGQYEATEFTGEGLPRVPTGKMLPGYVSREDQIIELDAYLGTLLRPRLRPDDVSQAEIAAGTRRWSGPEYFVLVDNEHLMEQWFASGGWSGKPFALANVTEFIPRSDEVGLHVIVARRINEWAKAAYTPLIAALKQALTPGLVMAGDRIEGVILGNEFPKEQPAGRGVYVTSDVSAPAQIARPDPAGTTPRWQGGQHRSTPGVEL
ncbi:type VII secretion protein EccCa [Mycobacteroides abscessus]|uniref:type VII secretion protein EccCa n=1 Tax=Mycobacteroides abscessus TaxID=36809 RepID=UPI000C25B3F2|nr:type VII secretion protein EccCa [Mycobacteroides abscessus]MBN7374150.1 type VII secretion protein EccCa [Mycobacteroides abscessus subsp. abscessus]RIR16435.1 type VII secretion protein EccCa [Mycobacteroides abscessus]